MYTTVNSVRLHYTQEGQGSDLVLVHGLGGSLHDWDACALDHILLNCLHKTLQDFSRLAESCTHMWLAFLWAASSRNDLRLIFLYMLNL